MNDYDLKDFVGKNFVDELPDDDSKIMIHFHTMILEIGSIIAALKIIKIVNNEWHDRVVKSSVRYDIIRNVTYESLFYRVVFGITKIFDIREKNGIFKILSKLRHSTKDSSLLSILNTIQDGIDKEQKKY